MKCKCSFQEQAGCGALLFYFFNNHTTTGKEGVGSKEAVATWRRFTAVWHFWPLLIQSVLACLSVFLCLCDVISLCY